MAVKEMLISRTRILEYVNLFYLLISRQRLSFSLQKYQLFRCNVFICVHKETIQVQVNILQRTRKKQFHLLHYKGILNRGKKDRGKKQMFRIRLNLLKLYTIRTKQVKNWVATLEEQEHIGCINTFSFKHWLGTYP